MQSGLENRRKEVNGLAATDQDVFMTVGAPSDYTYRVYRFDHALQNPKLVVDKLRGCCGTMDVQAHGDKLFVAHNARHKVEVRDRDGAEIAKFGTKGKVKAADFGGCCEPKCLRVLPGGDVLTAKSGPPTCIKRFSSTGEFIEVVAVVAGAKGDCVRVTVAASPDGSRYYMLDTTQGRHPRLRGEEPDGAGRRPGALMRRRNHGGRLLRRRDPARAVTRGWVRLQATKSPQQARPQRRNRSCWW